VASEEGEIPLGPAPGAGSAISRQGGAGSTGSAGTSPAMQGRAVGSAEPRSRCAPLGEALVHPGDVSGEFYIYRLFLCCKR